MLTSAIGKIGDLSSSDCREHVTRDFRVDSMVSGHEDVYARLKADPESLREQDTPPG